MVESTNEELEEPECEITELHEKEIDWIEESIDNWCHESGNEFHQDAIYWGQEIDTRPRAGDSCGRRRRQLALATDAPCTKKREMSNDRTIVKISSCQTYDDYELVTQCTKKREMSNEVDDYESVTECTRMHEEKGDAQRGRHWEVKGA